MNGYEKNDYIKFRIFADRRYLVRKLAFLAFYTISFLGMAQSITTLKAVDDTLRTGPLQVVRKNVIDNDIIPGDNYRWKLITTASPSLGKLAIDGDYLIFTPDMGCRNTSFTVSYELSWGNAKDTANVFITVSAYNNPVNMIDANVACYEDMPTINFNARLKYQTTPRNSNNDYIDAFASPLVGDLDGDGKPEIVIMGNSSSGGNGAATQYQYINIYNGQTGKRVCRYDFSNDYGFMDIGSPFHRPPTVLALADLDNDGKGEIVMCHAKTGRVIAFKLKAVANRKDIFTLVQMWEGRDNNNNVVSYKAPATDGQMNDKTYFGYPNPYIADLNGDGIPEVIVYNKIYNGATGRLLMSWQGEASTPVKSSITSSFGLRHLSYQNPVGSAENRDEIRASAMTGRRYGRDSYADNHLAVPVIVDIDGDGKQEIITGNRIHKFNFNSLTDHTKNTYYTIEGPQQITVTEGTRGTGSPHPAYASATYYLNDGFTRVADMDGDGKLDIIVACQGNEGHDDDKIILYVWDLDDLKKVKACISFGSNTTHGSFSIPFIGDINGKADGWDGSAYTKKLPEICILSGEMYIDCADSYGGRRTGVKFHPTTDKELRRNVGWDNNSAANGSRFNRNVGGRSGHIIGFTWDDAATDPTEKLKVSWAMEHKDESNNTGITLFDFDNNNTADLCYRDEHTLRIISPAKGGPNGTGKDYIDIHEDTDTKGTSVIFSTPVFSGTAFEYPTIADVNMDGSADIIVTNIGSHSVDRSRGWIEVYEYSGQKWAPCPPVWNQGMYDPTQIREDLKINARPLSMLTKFKKNGETICPYNGSWIQCPIVKEVEDYVAVVRLPDAHLLNMEVHVFKGNNQDSLKVNLTIKNRGSASINGQTPVTFYDGGTAGLPLAQASLIGSRVVGVDIFPDEKVTLTYTLPGKFNNKLIWARIMDSYGVFPAKGYVDCDLSNNTFSAIDCPYLSYSVNAFPDSVICGTRDSVILTAVPKNPAQYTPAYQWYRNDVLLSGATAKTYTATMAGEYKCYVTEDICRKFSATVTLTRNVPLAMDDHISVVSSIETLFDVTLNDDKSNYCIIIPKLVKHPKNGKASVVGNKISYKSNTGYIGKDTLTYRIDDSEANVYLTVSKFPDNLLSGDKDCHPSKPAFSFDIDTAYISNPVVNAHTGTTTIAGDIDGDGKAEILALSDDLKKIYVFEGNTGKQIGEISFPDALETKPATCFLIVDGKKNGKAEIFIAGTNIKKMYLYEVNTAPGIRPIGFTKLWEKPFSASGCEGIIPVVADFDGDGVVEFVAGRNLISHNGEILATFNFASIAKHTSYPVSLSYAADVDGDGSPEIIAGSEVYKWDGKNLTLYAQCPNKTGKDGTNVSGDINGDGIVDLVFCTDAGKYIVWTPALAKTSNVIIDSIVIPSVVRSSVPFVGDIDGKNDGGKKYAEICFFTNGSNSGSSHLRAYTCKGNRIAPKWEMQSANFSGVTAGITAFDFDLDGVPELVYRDKEKLYIVNGKNPTPQVLKTISCYSNSSGTAIETPVLADVTGDGSVNIIVAGSLVGSGKSQGRIMVFEGKRSKWASSPNVWNQQMYSPLWVNGDLSIPTTLPPQTLDYRQTCTAGSTLYYNGIPMQSPYLNEATCCPIELSSDIYVVDGSISITGDSIHFSVTFGNQGRAVASARMPIQYYADAIDSKNIIGNTRLGVDLLPGRETTIKKSIKLNSIPDQLYMRILDDGKNFPALGAYSDCNLTNNQKAFGTLETFKTVNSNTACIGGTDLFVVKIFNNTGKTKYNIVLTDSLGNGLEFLSATSSAGNVGTYNHANRKIEWKLDSLQSGADAIWAITTKALVSGVLRNYVWDNLNGSVIGKDIKEAYVVVGNAYAPVPPTLISATPITCIGDSVLLTASTGWASSYVWYRDYMKVAESTTTDYQAKKSGDYAVMYFDGTCYSSLSNVIRVNDFPSVADIKGAVIVCHGNTVQLSNKTPGGVWTSNNNNVSFDNPHANPVTVAGLKEGESYITYTVSNGVCQTRRTFSIRIIPYKPPKIIIGFPM
ncbi:MAG: FG-GAP-like repeat-containing protein [Bacteroidales bacterium]|jgi:uncharacterized repeat protein (TIGR01451 family)|nr:FG-GAP-like repeat-containing protein [Bacteroidales bacterium]